MSSASFLASSSYASKGNSMSESLAPKTLARVGKEVRDLIKNPPEGCKLIVDPETGLPHALNELMVSLFRQGESFDCLIRFYVFN
jgi:hypothetical protein